MEIQRYHPVWIPGEVSGESYTTILPRARGDYVLFDDHEAAMKAKDAEIEELRVIASAASRYVTFPCAHFRQELKAALAELDAGRA